jgi:hypothetical protein
MYNSFQAVLDAYALVGNSTASIKEEEQIVFQNYLSLRDKFCENYLEKALNLCIRNSFDNLYKKFVFNMDYHQMNTLVATHVLNDVNEVNTIIVQPFGKIFKRHYRPLVALSDINDAEITLKFTYPQNDCSDYYALFGFGEVTRDGLIFHCYDCREDIKDCLCKQHQSSWGEVVKVGFEYLGEFEKLGENKHKRNMLLSTTAAVNRSLLYLPNLINLIDVSGWLNPWEGDTYTSEQYKCYSSYFPFISKLPKRTHDSLKDWKAYCSLLWDIVKENLCVTDSRRIIVKSEPLFKNEPHSIFSQRIEESFDDLQSFIEWYINFRYLEFSRSI